MANCTRPLRLKRATASSKVALESSKRICRQASSRSISADDTAATTGSRATLFSGNAAKAAAEEMKKDLDKGLKLKDMVGKVYAGDVVIQDTNNAGVNVVPPSDGVGSIGTAALRFNLVRAVNIVSGE